MGRVTALLACATAMTFLVAASSVGCASAIGGNGPQQQVYVNSKPHGAAVMIDGIDQGLTPTRVTLDRKKHHRVRLTLAGYQPHEQRLKSGMNHWFWGNFILLGMFPVGMGVDLWTGGVQSLSPAPLRVRLVAER